jgi:uncharacterized protein
MINPKLLEILACPACDDRPPVRLVDAGLKCDQCGRIYPIKDGYPEMLVESATLGAEEPAAENATAGQ